MEANTVRNPRYVLLNDRPGYGTVVSDPKMAAANSSSRSG
jgi:hypothetical protein